MFVEVVASARAMIDALAAQRSFDAWRAKTQAAAWASIMDVKRTFASVSQVVVASGRTALVFNLAGGRRLITVASYPAQVVVVHFALAHSEYDKNKWKGKL